MKEQTKKKETFMCQTGYLPRPRTSMYPPEILHAGRVRQLHILSFMKIGWGVSELRRVENRTLPLTWPMAYSTVCILYRTSRDTHAYTSWIYVGHSMASLSIAVMCDQITMTIARTY